MLDYIEAVVKLGLPMVALSWWTYSWLYRNNKLDRELGRKATEQQLKALQRSIKAARKQRKKNHSNTTELKAPEEQDFWMNKWMRMGGGFYGLTSLWTLLVIEARELFGFLINFGDSLRVIFNEPGAALGAFITNQLQNFGMAFAWVVYWDDGFSIVWFIAAYCGYLVGIQIAKREDMRQVLNRFGEQTTAAEDQEH